MKMLERNKYFKCDKCGEVFSVETEFEQCYTLPKPTKYSIMYNITVSLGVGEIKVCIDGEIYV